MYGPNSMDNGYFPENNDGFYNNVPIQKFLAGTSFL